MIRRTHKARVSRPVFDAPDPIDAYLDALWLSLRNQADRNDLVAEAEDHLREAVERQVTSGTEPSAAHELALREFGDAALVARALVRTRLHTVPRPTPATRAAGRLGKWAGIAWLLAVATYVYQLCSNPWLAERYLLFQVVAGMATLLTSVLMFGLFARAGAARSPRLMLALPVTLLTLAGNTVFTWMWSITNLQLALTLWLALLECRRAGLWPGHGVGRLSVLIWPLAALVSRAGSLLRIGPLDEYGDYPLLDSWAFSCAAAAFALACWLIGSALASEPVDEAARVRLVPAMPIAVADPSSTPRTWPAGVAADGVTGSAASDHLSTTGSSRDTDRASTRRQPDSATQWGPPETHPH